MASAAIKFAVIVLIFSVFAFYAGKTFFQVPPVPKMEEKWWGPGSPSKDTGITPFKINVSDEVLRDLQHRLTDTLPFQEPLEGAKQHYGMNTNLLKTVVEFWRNNYRWRDQEKFLNKFPQFKVGIQGLNIHYIHVKPEKTKGVKVRPLLLLHGWPGSVREFYEIIPLLTTPQKGRDIVFEVIVPSLPGYGFSDAAVRPGLNAAHMGIIMKNLMQKLGFDKYYVQGGDWGALIVQQMSVLFPEKLLGVHSNMCVVNTALSNLKLFLYSFYPSAIIDEKLQHLVYPMTDKWTYIILETGYLHLQATKPDTIGVALRDSPVGLAAYILEKFTTWTNPAWKDLDDGGLTKKYTLTKLLDNVMIYWVTRSITTSMRLYSESFSKETMSLQIDNIPTKVPYGCARFWYELAFQPEAILREMFQNLVHVSDYEGGHFAAFEEPAALAQDIFKFTDKVEKL
ncbi:juvenile hormone epoxide hydrolase 1 [Leptinotarsa decemlineata]|uniref:juvenile hormone epoxide hydrolase 1 n=1 Tax=Leptinotarsa decemlineata TaxID=7539 RepID=UPI003D30A59D